MSDADPPPPPAPASDAAVENAPAASDAAEALPVSSDSVLSILDAGARAILARFLEPVEAPAGTVVVAEGAHDRAMYFVIAGEAALTRGEVDLGRFRTGEHFGEFELVNGRPRAASVTACTDMRLARLSRAGFEALAAQHPAMVLGILQAFLERMTVRMVDMADSVGMLLHERSLPRRTESRVTVGGVARVLRTGMPVGALLPSTIDDQPVVAALVDRKPVSLSAPVIAACTIEPLTTAHWEAQRIYRHSIGLLLLEAAARLGAPPLRLGHSLGFAQRVTLLAPEPMGEAVLVRLAGDLASTMHAIVEQDLPLREELWAVDEAREHFAAAGWTEAVHVLQIWREDTVPLVSYGHVYALRMGPLLPRTSVIRDFRVLPEENGLLLVYDRHAASRPVPPDLHVDADLGAGVERAARAVEAAPQGRAAVEASYVSTEARAVSQHELAMTEEHARWLVALQMDSVGAFNRACIAGDVTQLIMVSEGFHEKRVSRIADEIRACEPLVKIVCIAGPSSAGKSTFIRRLRVQMQVLGLRPLGISLDDYYVDRVHNPLDENGEYDFEAFDAMRVDLLQDHIKRLLRGEAVATAHFDFRTGTGHANAGPVIQLGERDVLMLEGIHGLNPRLLGNIPDPRIFRIFVCPLTQLPFDRLTRVYASDVRLIRRIVRDRHARGYDAAANIMRWPSVRAGERKHIFPFQRHADAVFDSSLIYELSVLKVYAERYLLEVPRDHPAYTTAFRLIGFLDRFVSIYPDHVPPTSLLREFIGGSGFEY